MHRKNTARRRRPGRRPPNRFRIQQRSPRAEGFNALGMGPVYKILIPQLRGNLKRALFNRISACSLLMFAAMGALLGASLLGPAGGILGLCVGLTGGGRFLSRERYFRT